MFGLKIHIYTLPLKSLESVRFVMFLKEGYFAHQGYIYLIKNTGEKTLFCEISLQFKIIVFYFNIFTNIIYSCDTALNFQHHNSSL